MRGDRGGRLVGGGGAERRTGGGGSSLRLRGAPAGCTLMTMFATGRSMILVACAFGACATASASDTFGSIAGTVVDDGGVPIPGALVTLENPTTIGGARQSTVDADGNFQFPGLSAGSFDMLTEMEGFWPVVKTGGDVQVGRTTQLTVEMKGMGAPPGERATIDTLGDYPPGALGQSFLQRIPTGRCYQEAIADVAALILAPPATGACPAAVVGPPPAVLAAPVELTFESDELIAEVDLSCGVWHGRVEVGAVQGSVHFDARSGVCNVTVLGARWMVDAVGVRPAGGRVRCDVQRGVLSCR